MDDSGLLIVVAGLGGAIVAVLGTLGATFLAHRYQAERDRKNDERNLRNIKTERVRRTYADLLAGARSAYYVAISCSMALDDSQALGRQMEELRKGTDPLAGSLALVSLEPDSDEVAERFDEVRKAFNEYTTNLELAAKNRGQLERGQMYYSRMESALATLEAYLPRLEEVARAHLERLERPI